MIDLISFNYGFLFGSITTILIATYWTKKTLADIREIYLKHFDDMDKFYREQMMRILNLQASNEIQRTADYFDKERLEYEKMMDDVVKKMDK